VPQHHISNGRTNITLEGISADLRVFGNHNLLNLHAAFFACKELGVHPGDFVQAIAGFTGASKRLEVLAASPSLNVYRDFAHAPSKVKATLEAVKAQYPDRRLIAVLELHTYSSLSEKFMAEYAGAMDAADAAAVFYAAHALELKRLPPLPASAVKQGFGKPGLAVLTDKEALQNWLQQQDYAQANLLLMSSGNYDGLDIVTFAQEITA
jgi:UDP-N-acetylmuramate: L-alanyl-gamma-D-glutamyl-meso-diaminopimelate ligase